ncbi:cytochrome-c peroxidase [Rhodobium gokarnense]|uniref:Cytochrome c peroxidase n=1 Tax=Rhodobium gokarnense TaxID=364296 RepID=A0ABT3HDT3_9HYPH|nr:cytochrome c peroxidase [Rhodobium gokarnense]MCW2308479.1 cytochrome c peroxidase [Rhodobium gokarnense]
MTGRKATFPALLLAAGLAAAGLGPAPLWAAEPQYATMEDLGEALFFDTNLSKNGTQACATCHSPDNGFTDPRETDAGRAVSLGDDGSSLGDRNAPTASYAVFSPPFHRREDGKYVGGQFLDGREKDLAGQAGGPPLNPIEMGMPHKAAVVERLKDNPAYAEAFPRLFGKDVFATDEAAYGAMAAAIAAFEGTDTFAPFDSKYDRFLRGEVKLTDQEELGRLLFFSQQFTNCNQCHQLRRLPGQKQETFSNYEYHNIGIPANTAVRVLNGVAKDHVDRGLLDNPAVDDPAEAGKFKVPTLRNVAVTGPYMHNGVFTKLRTAILFYNKYNSKNPERQVNPETGQPWRQPEVAENISLKELESGPALEDKRIDALVAFLKTLTDKRYEHLLKDD